MKNPRKGYYTSSTIQLAFLRDSFSQIEGEGSAEKVERHVIFVITQRTSRQKGLKVVEKKGRKDIRDEGEIRQRGIRFCKILNAFFMRISFRWEMNAVSRKYICESFYLHPKSTLSQKKLLQPNA